VFIDDYAITTETGRVELVAIRNITKNQELLNTMGAVIEKQGKIRRNCRVISLEVLWIRFMLTVYLIAWAPWFSLCIWA